MTHYQNINHKLIEGTAEIQYAQAHGVFSRLYRDYRHKFLFESNRPSRSEASSGGCRAKRARPKQLMRLKDASFISPIYGRLSVIGVDPVLRISGKGDRFEVVVLNKRGQFYFQKITAQDLAICDSVERNDTEIHGTICREQGIFEETKRSKQKNISQIIRIILEKFHLDKRSLLGLYGTFSYDAVRLFEKLEEKLPNNDINDFDLFLYDTFVFFDHLKERSQIITFRAKKDEIDQTVEDLTQKIEMPTEYSPIYKINNAKFSLSENEYENLVNVAKDYTKKGELVEIVFSNILKADFCGDPFALYLKYREINPSPYLFYFDFGSQQLVGASPEMMVRVEQNIVHTRPISGTAKRGDDPIEDHENMLGLLIDKKERAELDMLIDLGRNDLSRICKSGVKITDYRFVEKYSKVMHTVAHLSGELKDGYTAFDALIACLNAGTLTGAPKIAAMNKIERHEKERRGFYGGTIGYLTFSGEMDSGIIIRTAHIKENRLRFQVGATLLFRSSPQREYAETINKARAFLNTLESNPKII